MASTGTTRIRRKPAGRMDVVEVLKSAQKPLDPLQVLARLHERGFMVKAKNPIDALRTRLNKDWHFKRVSPNQFVLKG